MPGPLTFGYLCDFRNPEPWRRDWHDVYRETLDFIVWSESTGFGGTWVPEHHGDESGGYMPSPFVLLAAIAARTSTIKLGSGIALAPLYDPVHFAEDCAVLDILSNGRLEMSLAIGYRRREYEAFGLDFAKRGQRFDEFLEIVRRLWAGESVTFEGKHYAVRNAAIRPLSPRGQIPLYIGGFADKALARVAKYGDGYFGNAEFYETYVEKLRAEGKDPAAARLSIQGLFATVARDPEQAMEEIGPYFHYVNNIYGGWGQEDNALGLGDDVTLKAMSFDDFRKAGILEILTPGAMIDRLKRLQAQVPVEDYALLLPPGIPPAQFRPYAELFAKEVIPAFR